MPTTHHTVANTVAGTNVPLMGGYQRQNGQQGIPWPFANYFPIVINDPFMAVYNAVSTSMYNAVSSMVEYGPEADICRKESKVNEKTAGLSENDRQYNSLHRPKPNLDRYQRKDIVEVEPNFFDEITMGSDSFGKIKKPLQVESGLQALRKSIPISRKRRDLTSIFLKTKQGDSINIALQEPLGAAQGETKQEGSDLILRKGGTAIAGPGGAATAYTGGTAIVGPYGTVYKSPAGTAILGPFAKVVNITDNTSFEEILKMHRQLQAGNLESMSRNQLPVQPQPKLNFKSFRNLFSYITDLPIQVEVKPQKKNYYENRSRGVKLYEGDIVKTVEEIRNGEFRRIVEDAPFEEKMVTNNETTLIFRPKSKAEAGRNGVALSAPTSHAILYPGQKANIYFEPESVASAGPLGFAHAHSDLFVRYITTTTTEQPVPEPSIRKMRMVLRSTA